LDSLLTGLLTILFLGQIVIIIVLSIYLKRVRRVLRAWRSLVENRQSTVLKPRKRYVVFSIVCEGKPSKESIEEHIERLFIHYYGRTAHAKASPQLIFFDEASSRGVFRVSHLYVKHLISLFTAPLEKDECKCLIIPLKTTGTLKKAVKILEGKH